VYVPRFVSLLLVVRLEKHATPFRLSLVDSSLTFLLSRVLVLALMRFRANSLANTLSYLSLSLFLSLSPSLFFPLILCCCFSVVYSRPLVPSFELAEMAGPGLNVLCRWDVAVPI